MERASEDDRSTWSRGFGQPGGLLRGVCVCVRVLCARVIGHANGEPPLSPSVCRLGKYGSVAVAMPMREYDGGGGVGARVVQTAQVAKRFRRVVVLAALQEALRPRRDRGTFCTFCNFVRVLWQAG